MEPRGAVFKLPLPFLWQHDSKSPIGQVVAIEVGNDGLHISAKIACGLLPEIDRAYTLIKAGLVRGLSVGFRGLDVEPIKGSGLRFKRWLLFEISAVTLPMNSEANIFSVRASDHTFDAADCVASPYSPEVTAILKVRAEQSRHR